MPYILDLDGDYVKKCETEDCLNVILIGVSRTKCAECLKINDKDVILKYIPEFNQRWPM